MKLKPHMCDFMQTRILKKVILKSQFYEKGQIFKLSPAKSTGP